MIKITLSLFFFLVLSRLFCIQIIVSAFYYLSVGDCRSTAEISCSFFDFFKPENDFNCKFDQGYFCRFQVVASY